MREMARMQTCTIMCIGWRLKIEDHFQTRQRLSREESTPSTLTVLLLSSPLRALKSLCEMAMSSRYRTTAILFLLRASSVSARRYSQAQQSSQPMHSRKQRSPTRLRNSPTRSSPRTRPSWMRQARRSEQSSMRMTALKTIMKQSSPPSFSFCRHAQQSRPTRHSRSTRSSRRSCPSSPATRSAGLRSATSLKLRTTLTRFEIRRTSCVGERSTLSAENVPLLILLRIQCCCTAYFLNLAPMAMASEERDKQESGDCCGREGSGGGSEWGESNPWADLLRRELP